MASSESGRDQSKGESIFGSALYKSKEENTTMKGLGKAASFATTLGVLTLALVVLNTSPVHAQASLPVRVTNTPTVTVGNTSATPLPVRNLDHPARQPFAQECFTITSNSLEVDCFLGSVPSGKRWVIETVSAHITVDPPVTPYAVNLQLQGPGLYADSGNAPVLVIHTSGSFATAITNFTAAGYLVDLP
jgi:hypothetical protein